MGGPALCIDTDSHRHTRGKNKKLLNIRQTGTISSMEESTNTPAPRTSTQEPKESYESTAPEPTPSDCSILDREQPRSIINLVPPKVGKLFEEAYKALPDLFFMSQHKLYKKISKDYGRVTPTDHRLRMSFWQEYDRAQADQTSIIMTNVYKGVCTREYLYGTYLQLPYNVAWLLCAPATYEVAMEEALSFGIDQLRDILETPHKDPKTGKVDTKLAALKAKIITTLDIRVKGAVTQKVDNRHLHISTSKKGMQEVYAAVEGKTMDDLDAKLARLEKRLNKNSPVALEDKTEEAVQVEEVKVKETELEPT